MFKNTEYHIGKPQKLWQEPTDQYRRRNGQNRRQNQLQPPEPFAS